MIDTAGFKTLISYETFEKIKEKTRMTQRIDKETGEIEFEYDNGKTNHSSNYNVIYKISDEYYESSNADDYPEGVSKATKIPPQLKTGIPSVKFEFSVAKILLTHNLDSVSFDLIYHAMSIVKTAFETKYGCVLPDITEWYCYRIDTCANYILSSENEARKYITYLSKLDYPRREPMQYGSTGLYWPSQQNTLKIYAKGPEFKLHDMKRFRGEYESHLLHAKAKKILRVEVEHKRSIKYLTKKYNDKFDSHVKDISEDRDKQRELNYLRHHIDRLEEAKILPDSVPEMIDKEIARITLEIQTIAEEKIIPEIDNSPEGKRVKTFEGYPQIKNLTRIFDYKSEMQRIIKKLLSGTESNVTKSLVIENRIRESCSKKQSSTYIAVYYTIINQGQSYAKQKYERNIYYRALRFFRDNGISLVTNSLDEKRSNDYEFPEDFRLDMDESNPYYQIPIQSMEEILQISGKGESF